MYKEMMDGQTVLFKSPTYSKAYNLRYLNEHYTILAAGLQDATEIYYKFNQSRSSWIDYRKALTNPNNKHLSYDERIIYELINNPIKDLSVLPETDYIDSTGYIYVIGARDGLDSTAAVRPLENYHLVNTEIGHYEFDSNGQKKLVSGYGYDEERGCKYLVVNFRADIRNALIIFNGLFEKYEILNNTTIIYYEEDGLIFPREYDEEGMFKIDKNGNPVYRKPEDSCSIIPYIWTSLVKKPGIRPVKIEDNWIFFDEEITTSSILFYNKVMYFYKVNKYDDHRLKIDDPDFGNLSNFDIDSIELIKFVELADKKDPETGEITKVEKSLKQQRLVGLFNTSDGNVYFPATVNNALITYNGIRNSYLIRPDKKSIKFKIPHEIYQINNKLEIDYDSKIYAINFYAGSIEEDPGYLLPQSKLTEVANDIIKEYHEKLAASEKKLNEISNIADLIYTDFNDPIPVEKDNQIKYVLKYKPIEHTLRFYVNGVRYEQDLFWLFNYENNLPTITWKYTSYNSGFDIKTRMNVLVVYDIDYAENSIVNKEDFKLRNK